MKDLSNRYVFIKKLNVVGNIKKAFFQQNVYLMDKRKESWKNVGLCKFSTKNNHMKNKPYYQAIHIITIIYLYTYSMLCQIIRPYVKIKINLTLIIIYVAK